MRPLLLPAALVFAALCHAQAIPAPRVDHHMHIASLQIAEFLSKPLAKEIQVPKEISDLLRAKEEWDNKKNRARLTDIYTDDAVVIDAGSSNWLLGKTALDYVAGSTTIGRLCPTSYQLGKDAGYVAGFEAPKEGDGYVSTFLYALKKGGDNKWRVSAETFTNQGPKLPEATTAARAVSELDAAGVQKGVILSVAYLFARGSLPVPLPDERARLQAENDWVAQQVAAYPDRLIGFFSVNPLRDYALEEIERCAKNPHFKGIKLHIANSRVDMLNPEHLEKLGRVFKAANEKRLAIVIHLWSSVAYTPQHAQAFIDKILPMAPDIPIQIAHLTGSGPNEDNDAILQVYTNAALANDPRLKNVYFDVASNIVASTPKEALDLTAKRLRELGLHRVLFASDRSWSNDTPGDAWRAFLRLPLTAEEFAGIANNVAPYVK